MLGFKLFNKEKYPKVVFEKWLNVYKKSIAVYLVLLAIENNFKWSKEIFVFLNQKGVKIEKNSLYRLLRRLEFMSLIKNHKQKSQNTGLERKHFFLTPEGKSVLREMKKVVGRLC